MLGNVLLGGLTSATRAAIGRKDVLKAFASGAFGGGVHVAGKNLAVEPGHVNSWLGLVVAGTGTSMVSNAGPGVGLLDEVTIPFAAARVRVTPWESRKVRVAVNLADVAAIAGAFATSEFTIDWSRSVSSGAAVFQLRRGSLMRGDDDVDGFARGPVIVIERRAMSDLAIGRHEVVHVHQDWFMQEAWGRPIEQALRRRMTGLRFIPSWLELGVVPYGLDIVDDLMFGEGGFAGLREAEAYRLMKR